MTRIVVMAANEVGVIADISRVLADNGINIETISAEALGDKATYTEAEIAALEREAADRRALTIRVAAEMADDALILSLRDEPGALARVAESLKEGGVNIQSLHILDRRGGLTTVAISTDDRAKAEGLVDQETVV